MLAMAAGKYLLNVTLVTNVVILNMAVNDVTLLLVILAIDTMLFIILFSSTYYTRLRQS